MKTTDRYCPRCHRDFSLVYKTAGPHRYRRCLGCGYKFCTSESTTEPRLPVAEKPAKPPTERTRCARCRKMRKVRARDAATGRRFCSDECRVAYLAENFG